jgi:dynein heavy chain
MCGTWALFRNIQSMDRLTLSVLGSCVSVVLKAIAAGSAKAVVGSSIIPVLPTCGFISAMLSSELQFTPIPESLRAIFRPCSILVPDVKVICEYFLLKAGFAAPRPTAASLCCLFATSPHVLGQSADAWNLRAMKHILDVLGPLRRSEAYVDVDDLGLVLRAARDLILPKLDRVETEVFTGLLASVFPFTSASRVMDEALADYVAHACDDIGLWADKEFSDNVLQLDELMDAFPAVVVAGPPCSAKSSIWKALLLARAKQNESSDKRAIVLYARLFSLESLYGSVDSSGEWVDGCLTRTLRNIDDADNTLLVLDGVMEVSVTERLRPLLRGPRSLLLPTHEVVSLPSRVGVLLETTDLSSASPAFLAHCGVLALANAGGGLRTSIFGSWVRCRPHEIFDLKAKENVFRLAEKYLTTSIQGLRTYVDNLNEASLALRLSKFLEVLLLPRAMLHQLTLLENVFVFALVWACGSCLMTATNSRAQFSEWFRKAFPDVKFPNAGSIFGIAPLS